MESKEHKVGLFQLSPMSWEESEVVASSKSTSSPVFSLRRLPRNSITSSTTLMENFKYRKNSENTPEITSQFLQENSSKLNILEIPISMDQESNSSTLLSEERKSEIAQSTCKNKSSSIPIPEFQLEPIFKNKGSFLTLDETYDSDEDMFEDFKDLKKKSLDSPLREVQSMVSSFLSNHSCQYMEGKLKFAPLFSLDRTNHLEELFNVSREEIKSSIDTILQFWQN